MPGPENMPIPDPLLPLAFVAAVTKKIRLATGILILPQRHPLYVAKEVATLDVLSNGRVILGIGSRLADGGVRTRSASRSTSAARAPTRRCARSARSGRTAPEAFEGKFYKWAPVESNPKPVQKPRRADRRRRAHRGGGAARGALGDGFFPAKRARRAAAGDARGVREARPRSREDRDHGGRRQPTSTRAPLRGHGRGAAHGARRLRRGVRRAGARRSATR